MGVNMYLIVGANGFLGTYIIEKVLKQTTEKIVAVSRNLDGLEVDNRIQCVELDISDVDAIIEFNKKMKAKNELLKIVYLAAYHHPDKVKENPKLAWEVNITSLSNFLNHMDNVQCLFYASTDAVYGESIDCNHFIEEDKLNPVNLYGKHKALAEHMVTTYGYNVVRFPFLIGKSLVKNRPHFFDVIINTLRDGNTMTFFEDSYRSSLDFGSAADYLVQLMEMYTMQMPKIINVSADKDMSKYDVALMIAEKYNLDKNLVIPIKTDEINEIFIEKRPKTTLLNNSVIKSILGFEEIKIVL